MKHHVAHPSLILIVTAVLASCSSTLPDEPPVVWGGLRVELAATDAAITIRRPCMTSRFDPLPPQIASEVIIPGKVISATAPSSIGMTQRLAVRQQADTLFISTANHINGGWTPYSRVDTLLRGEPGRFPAEGGSCIL